MTRRYYVAEIKACRGLQSRLTLLLLIRDVSAELAFIYVSKSIMATTYQFKAASWVLYVLKSIIVSIAGIILITILLLTNVFPKGNLIIGFTAFTTVALLVIYLRRLAAFANIEIVLSEDSISINWLQQFLFSNRSNGTINFKDIEEYKIDGDSNWDELKFKLHDETIYRIWHSKSHNKDDYKKLTTDLMLSINDYNQQINAGVISNSVISKKTKTIHLAKNFYETKWGIVLEIVFVLILIIMLISYLL